MKTHSFVSSPGRIALAFATSRPPRDAQLYEGGSIRTRNFVSFIYLESACEKSGKSSLREPAICGAQAPGNATTVG
jgi:hypothetical protein